MKAQNESCGDFRSALSRALEGRPQPAELEKLAWHEHLLSCGECRELLEREEALEVLLASLPEPNLPPDLTRRLIRSLERASEGRYELDSLLELDGAAVPAGLAGRIAAGVRAERALDDLLERDQVVLPEGLAERVQAGLLVRREAGLDGLLDLDVVEVPADLAARVLTGLEREATASVKRSRFRLLKSPLLYAAAAGLLLLFFVSRPGSQETPGGDEVARLGTSSDPDPELLDMLHVLERDELWSDTADGGGLAMSEADLELLLSEAVDIDDELLLAYIELEDEPSDG